MIEHLLIATVDSDAKVLVDLVLLCPSDFVLEGAAHGDYSSTGDAVEKSMDVSFALKMG